MQEEQIEILIMRVFIAAIESDMLNNAFWHTRWATAKNNKTALKFAERVDDAFQRRDNSVGELNDALEKREANAFKSDCWRFYL
jgi:hypothetical protein